MACVGSSSEILAAFLPAALYAACFTPGGLRNILNSMAREDTMHDKLVKACERFLLGQRELIPKALFIPTSGESHEKCNLARNLSLHNLTASYQGARLEEHGKHNVITIEECSRGSPVGHKEKVIKEQFSPTVITGDILEIWVVVQDIVEYIEEESQGELVSD
jgi:hypothetical protein